VGYGVCAASGADGARRDPCAAPGGARAGTGCGSRKPRLPARHVAAGEHQPAINHNGLAVVLKQGHVFAYFSQAAQVLGEQHRNTEALEKAVETCRAALEVRTRDAHPTLWASTQNNLGSALFLLGKRTGKKEHLEGAAEAFTVARDFYTEQRATRAAAISEKNLSHVERLLEKHDTKRVPKMRWEKD